MVRVLDELKASHSASGGSEQDLDGLVSLLDELRGLCCSNEGSENGAIAVQNGVVEALVRSGSAGEATCIDLEDTELRAPWYDIGVLAGSLRCVILFGNLHGSSIQNMLVIMTS